MEEPKKKLKPLSVIFLAVGAVLLLAAVYFMFFKGITVQSADQKEAVSIYEATAQDAPAYLELQYMTESIAYMEAVESMQYYITFDAEWNPAVICLYDSEMEKYQPYIDWLYTEDWYTENEENGPEEIKVTGYSVPYDAELRQFTIEGINASFGVEFITEDNFEEVFGEYYLTVGQNSGAYESFNTGIYCLLAAVVIIVIGVAISYSSLKSAVDAEAGNYLEVHKTYKGRGILGAFLGALLGAILWAAVGALGYISGWIGVLMVLFATTGYKLFAKEESKLGTVLAVVFSLILVLPATYFAGVWVFYQELNKSMAEYITLGRAFQGFSAYLTKYDAWGDMIYNIAMGYVFMLVAGGYSIAGMNKRKKQEAASTAEYAAAGQEFAEEQQKEQNED